MSLSSAGVPRLPNSPDEYDSQYFEQVWKVLRQWAGQVVSPSNADTGLFAVNTTTATTVLVGLSGGLYLVSTTGGSVTVTLPAPANCVGQVFTIKRTTAGANTLTIGASSGNIDGSATTTLVAQYSKVSVRSDGTNYWIV